MSDFDMPPELGGEKVDYDIFVDGGYVRSDTNERLDVKFPYDGTIWATVPDSGAADVDSAVGAARAAFEAGWADCLPSTRRDVLHEIADIVEEYAAELSRLTVLENGRLISEMERYPAAIAEWYRYYASHAMHIEGKVVPVENKGGDMLNYTRKDPYGVVVGITPWNSPLLLTAWKLAPALAAGNTFVHKPSEHTPVGALRFAELLHEHTALPDGVYNVVTGASGTGAELTEHKDVDKLAFTGSAETGREVGKQAAERLVPTSLELGGKTAQVLFPSTDLEDAINGVANGIFPATGQMCQAGSRVVVHEDIHDEVVEGLVDRAETIKFGNPFDRDAEMAPVAFREQWEKVIKYIELGRSEGATIEYGGKQPADLPGQLFIMPTIMTDASNQMQVAREEIFGPVVTVIPFSNEAEALEIANDTDYGLGASVWSEDMRQCIRVADELEAGSVYINEFLQVSHASPYGGYKDSGIGREGGEEGLDEYLQTKAVWIDLSGEVPSRFQPR